MQSNPTYLSAVMIQFAVLTHVHTHLPSSAVAVQTNLNTQESLYARI